MRRSHPQRRPLWCVLVWVRMSVSVRARGPARASTRQTRTDICIRDPNDLDALKALAEQHPDLFIGQGNTGRNGKVSVTEPAPPPTTKKTTRFHSRQSNTTYRMQSFDKERGVEPGVRVLVADACAGTARTAVADDSLPQITFKPLFCMRHEGRAILFQRDC